MAILTSESIIGIFACLGAFLVVFYVSVIRNFKYWKKLGVKQVEPSFPFGNAGQLITLKKSIHEFIADVYAEGAGEKMVGCYVFGKPYLLLRDPELLRCVFIKDFSLFPNKLICNNKADPFGTHTLFLVRNPPWKYVRQNMSPMFTSGKLKNNYEQMLEMCKDLDFYLKSLGVNDKFDTSVEVRETCGKLMTDLIGVYAYNVRFDSLINPEAPFRKHGKSFAISTFLRYLQFMSILFVPAFRSISNARFFATGTDFFQETFSHIVDERIKSGDKKNDFVDLIIDMMKNEEKATNKDYKVGRHVWMAQLSGIFAAGFETSSTTTSFGLYHIATDEKIKKKLRKELLEAMEKTNGKLTYDIVVNAPYLDMVTQETLRLYPILTWVDRMADVDYTFPGTNITVQKGTPIIFPIRCMHMDPQYFPNPEKFDPERFSKENKNKMVSFTFAPFSEGPRSCIGNRLGLLQVKLALAYLIINYEMSPCDATPLVMKSNKINVFMHPETDIYINLKKLDLDVKL